MSACGILIVGAGQAAGVAALALRELGYSGRITMVGQERHRPYERPPLSKGVLVDAQEPDLDVMAVDAWTQADIVFLPGQEVQALDLAQRQARLALCQVQRLHLLARQEDDVGLSPGVDGHDVQVGFLCVDQDAFGQRRAFIRPVALLAHHRDAPAVAQLTQGQCRDASGLPGPDDENAARAHGAVGDCT